MSLRTSLTRLAIATAAGALVAGTVAAVPAFADEGSGSGSGNSSSRSDEGRDSPAREDSRHEEGRHEEGRHDSRGHYRGLVTADRLLLRTAPNRGSRVIRSVHRGQIVSIYCKTSGERIDGNRLWYLLTDGTWAWGSARYIDNLGAAPRWC
ncbi:SH3 domain-containing protein [Streptomyces sp. NPDC056716]|uniref:SH3 domain-containing protein n=1 Tax=unclassified Streptomyces TaxID=2593676 RepID=UPI0036D17CE4